MGSGNNGRLPDRLGVNPSAGPGAFHPETFGNRMPQSGFGNSENAGHRCHNNLIRGTGSVCRPYLPEAEKDGSQRPVFNPKPLNMFVWYQHFKMEGMTMVLDLMQEWSWMTKVDLKDMHISQ